MPLTHALKRRRTRAMPVFILGLVGIIISIAAYRIARSADFDRVKAILELRVEWRARDIERKLALTGRSAEALAVYVAAEGEITAARFHNFARLAQDGSGSIGALYWSPWVNGRDRASFVAAVRRDGDPGYDIMETGPGGTLVPAATRSQYVPRLYEEAFDHATGARGFDLLSRPETSVLIDRVRDGGSPLSAPPSALPMDGSSVPGFVIGWPVYTTGVVPSSVEARRAAFRGISAARFRLDRVLPSLIEDTPDIIGSIDLAAGSQDAAAQPIASFDTSAKQFIFGEVPARNAPGSILLVREFNVFGQSWILSFHFRPEILAAMATSAPLAWLIISLITTAMLVVYAWRQSALLGKVAVVASETEDRFRRLFDENPIGMVIATAQDYRFVRVNAAFCRMLGYTSEELVGHQRDEFAASNSVGMPQAVGSDSGVGWHPVDKNFVCKSGKIVSARVRVMRLAPSTNNEALVLVLAEDVSDQRKMEAALRHAQKMEAIGLLSGGLAHDFNNLLGIIIGNLDLLQTFLQDQGEGREMADEALLAALRGADLTRRLLAFARRQPLHPERIALNERMIEISKLLTHALGERIRIALNLGPEAWSVMADPIELDASIVNLATNARDAMPAGGTLTIATANRQLDAHYAELNADVTAGDYALIEISDSGTGMTAEVLAHIFEPFFTTKAQGKGTGLGLSMVFGFLKQSQGHISVHSEPGAGSTFRLYFPRAGGAAELILPPPRREVRRGSGETVLVVEDSEPLRRIVVRQLNDLGYLVIEADGAGSALAVLASRPVALVFTDVVMPGELDGFGLANQVLSRWPAIKVLLTSGFPEANINDRLGASAVSARLLGKPYRTDDLARMVREVLEA